MGEVPLAADAAGVVSGWGFFTTDLSLGLSLFVSLLTWSKPSWHARLSESHDLWSSPDWCGVLSQLHCAAVAQGPPPSSDSSMNCTTCVSLSSGGGAAVAITSWANPASIPGGTVVLTNVSLNMSQVVDLAAFTAHIWVLSGIYLIITLTHQKKACSALGTGSSCKVGSITAGVDAGVVTAISLVFTSGLVVESGC